MSTYTMCFLGQLACFDVPERNRVLLILEPDVSIGKLRVANVERRFAVQHDNEVIAVGRDLKLIPLIRLERVITGGLRRSDDGAGVVASRLLLPDLDLVAAGFVWRSHEHAAVGQLRRSELERQHV